MTLSSIVPNLDSLVQPIIACSTCMAGEHDVNTRAAGWSILFLLAIIGPVLFGVIRFAFHLRKAANAANSSS
ncbi:MAG: hypothetical protein AAGA58_04965 [Verrucomicrobiota bacterium]